MKRMILNVVWLYGLALFVLAFASEGIAQGKGKGNSGNKGNSGQSQGNKGNSGKSDDSIFDDDKEKSKSRGKNSNLLGSDNRYKGLSKKLGRSPESLKAWYESERAFNRDLTYGQFVAANMVSQNHSGISANTILAGLRRGESIGQTLKRKGWDDDRIKNERKRLKKLHDDDDDGLIDYIDRDIDWRF